MSEAVTMEKFIVTIPRGSVVPKKRSLTDYEQSKGDKEKKKEV